ncbi:MAG: serine acetyltransferase [Bacteroidaceae bacterium]|nr:serine acetyltransferase [Bacteroidaceae bacterium]
MSECLYTKDLFRYYGNKKIGLFKSFFIPIELRFIKAFRMAQYYRNKKFCKILYWFWELRKRQLSLKTHIQIPTVATIGPGLYIGHFGRVILNSKVVLGKNVTINTGVTIGQTNRGKKKGVPIVGDNVWIGTNAVVVGNICIGDDVLIAPNSYVTDDVPSHSIVKGNPAVVIHREDATKGYIEHVV